jgi:transcriptional regulator with XRE-family HTH domain
MSDSVLQLIGTRLRNERLKKNDAQANFAARLGVSVPTLRRMESGDGAVQIGYWLIALRILGREKDFSLLLAPKEDLFAKFNQAKAPARQRASRKASL